MNDILLLLVIVDKMIVMIRCKMINDYINCGCFEFKKWFSLFNLNFIDN